MMQNFAWSALVMIGCVNALPTTMERMTLSRMRMADLETSATGYTYNQQPGRQASYVQYTNHGTGGYYDAPKPIQYITYRKPEGILHSGPTVITSLPAFKNGVSALPPRYVVPLLQAPNHPPLAPYYVPAKIHSRSEQVNEDDDDDDDEDDEEDSNSDENDNEEEDGETTEEHGGGEDFNVEEHSSHGENGDKGYTTHHKFDNGEQGKHHKDRHEGHYSDEGGNEKSYSENAGNYGNYDEADKGNEDESYGQQKYHKKGEKTTGFHNVYRKNEYKKDTDFYDNDHKSGHYDKHSSSGQHHSSADGGYEKGGQHNSGYEDREKGKDGHYDKGHDNSHHKGSRSKEGDDSYYKNHSDYAAKDGSEGSKKYGYVDGQQ